MFLPITLHERIVEGRSWKDLGKATTSERQRTQQQQQQQQEEAHGKQDHTPEVATGSDINFIPIITF